MDTCANFTDHPDSGVLTRGNVHYAPLQYCENKYDGSVDHFEVFPGRVLLLKDTPKNINGTFLLVWHMSDAARNDSAASVQRQQIGS